MDVNGMTGKRKVAFATCEGEPDICSHSYSGDDKVATELSSKGYVVDAVPWDKPDVAWKTYESVIIRSTWDYHLQKVEKFRQWCRYVESIGVQLCNGADIVLWNSDKHYLLELQSSAIDTIPTVYVDKSEKEISDTKPDVANIMKEQGWPSAVVKPSVSANSYRTEIVKTLSKANSICSQFSLWLADHDMMVQKYIPELETEGEWSLIYIDGQYSHAVLKKPIDGLLKEKYPQEKEPPAKVLQLSEKTMTYIRHKFGHRSVLYSRVDIVTHQGQALLMEVELIEPNLYLNHHPQAITRLTSAIQSLSKHSL